MKKWWVSIVIAACVLSACGEGKQQLGETTEQPSATVISVDQSFTHEMEHVHVTMNGYRVEQFEAVTEAQQQQGLAIGDRLLQGDIIVQNDTTTSIYFSPDVYVFLEGQQIANEAERYALGDAVAPVTIAPGANATFTLAFRLPESAAGAEQVTMQIPVAFTEANSTSSGDALGDIGEWILSLN